ncbi:cysteine dioxygenase family protein [Vasconcelosia minhoensis]|nr:cupin [Romeria gracilis]
MLQNWLVTDDGRCRPLVTAEIAEPERTYRLYRFLTELEDILDQHTEEVERIAAIVPRVRQLLTSSYWLQMEFKPPTEQGWAVNFLYREHQFPLTVQMVTWAPGSRSQIHNHATWGIIAMVGGQEKNTLWRRDPDRPEQIQPAGELILAPGDIIGLTADAIHCVEPLADEPTVSFNLYGITDRSRRYQFDPDAQTAAKF